MTEWEAIKAEYVTGDISYRKLAEKHGVSFRTLSDRALKQEWPRLRQKHRDDIVRQTVQKTARRESSSLAAKLVKLQSAADSMAGVIDSVFADTEQFKRHIITTGLGMGATEVSEKVYNKVDAKAIRDLTASIKDLVTIVRNLYDLPTVQEQRAMDIAADRLKLEQQKADLQADAVGDADVVVTFDDAASEEWSK